MARSCKQFATLLLLAFFAVTARAQDDEISTRYTQRVPIGNESLTLESSKNNVQILVTAECEEWDGWVVRGTDPAKKRLLDREGNPVQHYPSRMRFRVTLTSRQIFDMTPLDQPTNETRNDFMKAVQFQLKIFDGLQQQVIKPVKVENIGPPANVASRTRVFMAEFELDKIPVDRRASFEILSGDKDRAARFPFSLR